MRRIAGLLLFSILCLLQLRLWNGHGSFQQVAGLAIEVASEEQKVTKLKERNMTLEAEVQDLKHRLGAIEERARTDLGMIRQNETFFQIAVNGP